MELGDLNQDKALSSSSRDAKWWETAEDHRFALEVLQHRLRREILKFIGNGIRTKEEIVHGFRLSPVMADYHLALLEKALVVEHIEGRYRSTPTGVLYLERVERSR